MHSQLIIFGLGSLVVLQLLIWIYQAIRSPLRSIPGPFIARFSRLWYFNRVRKGDFHHDNIGLHRKYGPIIRVSPDHYSLDDPAAVKEIYGIGTHFRKSDWYYGWQHPDPNRVTVFADRDIQHHGRERRKFNGLFTTSNLVNYEPFVDQCAEIFSKRLAEHADSGKVMDMGHWFQCYAFDVIACITYGSRFGFLDAGEDIDGAMEQLWKTDRYSTLIGIFAEWHAALFSSASKLPWTGAAGRVFVMKFVQAQVEKRKAERKQRDVETGHATAKQEVAEEGMPEDFLEKMLNAHEADPDKITAYDVFAMGMSNIIAGSDTTAVSLSTILYHLLKNPRTLQKLREELAQKESEGELEKGNPKVTFKQSLSMPYLQAVMKEALRLHPATGLPLWRVVPPQGFTHKDHFFPAGTVIGINTWTAHYNPTVFPDPKIFRPERWIDAEPEKLKQMDAYYMPFGLGARTCMGRHVSELEMSKLIPGILREFDFEFHGGLEREGREWETENFWFVKPMDFVVKVSRRL